MRASDDGVLRVRLKEAQRRGDRRTPRAAPQGPARGDRALAEEAPGRRRDTRPRRRRTARTAGFLRFRAGRHRQHSDELRFPRARRGAGHRARAGRGPEARPARAGGNEEDSPACATCNSTSNSIIPRWPVDIDRQKAGLSGVAVKDVTDALLVGTSSSRYVVQKLLARSAVRASTTRCKCRSPRNGWTARSRWKRCPSAKVSADSNLLIRDVATVQPGTTPGEIDRIAMQRYLSITANIEGDDLGRAAGTHRPRHRRRRRTSPRRARRGPRPGRADDRDVPLLERGPGALGGGDPGAC